jgi:hypothetical protein
LSEENLWLDVKKIPEESYHFFCQIPDETSTLHATRIPQEKATSIKSWQISENLGQVVPSRTNHVLSGPHMFLVMMMNGRFDLEK